MCGCGDTRSTSKRLDEQADLPGTAQEYARGPELGPLPRIAPHLCESSVCMARITWIQEAFVR